MNDLSPAGPGQNLLDDLRAALLKEPSLLDGEGQLLRAEIVARAFKLDAGLLRLLLASEPLKRAFFRDIDGVLVFDALHFQDFVSNRELLPDSFTAFSNRIGLASGGRALRDRGEVVLEWPYKDCVLEGGQTKEEQGRREVFWNQTLAPDDITRLFEPKALTGWERWDAEAVAAGQPAPVVEVRADDNLLLKGNNLLALHSLKARFAGKVKLIYIDPPYNTGSDGFRYNDRFNHSSWLTFMRNRLEVAKRLLHPSLGVLAISIDHNEAFHLKVLCDEIFGRENFLTSVSVQNNAKGRVLDKNFSTSHEYILFYQRGPLERSLSVRKTDQEISRDYPERDNFARFRYLELRNTHREFGRHNRENLYFPLYVNPESGYVSLERDASFSEEILPIWDDGFEGCWTWGESKCRLQEDLLRGRLLDGRFKIFRKAYAIGDDGENVSKQLKSMWFHKDFLTDKGQAVVDDLLGRGAFRSPKPVGLLKLIVDLATDGKTHDIVLDFFSGSGTTAHAVLELNKADRGNRRFILVEQMDYARTVALERMKKVMGGSESVVYAELARWNGALVDRIEAAATDEDLAAVRDEVLAKGYLRHEVDTGPLASDAFAALSLAERKGLLVEVLDLNHLHVARSDMEDATYGLSDEDRRLTRGFYGEGA